MSSSEPRRIVDWDAIDAVKFRNETEAARGLIERIALDADAQASIRDTAIASSLAAGAGKVGDATPMLLPVAALLAFALTNTALGRSRGDG